jgi:nucleotide-binding universal stress UspA family protein
MECDLQVIWVRRPKRLMDDDQVDMLSKLAEEKLVSLCEKYQPMMKSGKMRWEICEGKVAPTLARHAIHSSAPLIVIGTNGASGFEKYWMGSTAVRIVQEATVPVITIRQGFNFHKDLERIVVPLRVNLNSRQKVPPAAEIARLFDSEVHLLGLFDDEAQTNELQIYLMQAAELLGKEGIRCTSAMKKYTNYSDALLGYAESIDADLVVINTEQDRMLAQLFLGTNAQQIVHNAQIPVLSVHPNDKIFTLSKS